MFFFIPPQQTLRLQKQPTLTIEYHVQISQERNPLPPTFLFPRRRRYGVEYATHSTKSKSKTNKKNHAKGDKGGKVGGGGDCINTQGFSSSPLCQRILLEGKEKKGNNASPSSNQPPSPSTPLPHSQPAKNIKAMAVAMTHPPNL